MPRGMALGVLICLAVLTGFASGQEVRLEWKLSKDQKFFVDSKVTISNNVEALGKQATEKTERSTLIQVTVLEKNDQGLVLEEQFESIALAVRDEVPANRFSTLLKDAKVKVSLDPRMKITRIEGLDDLLKKLAGEDAEARKTVQSLFSEEMLRRTVEELVQFLPDGPVKPGATWNRESLEKIDPLGQSKRNVTYQFEGQDKIEGTGENLEKITFNGTVSFTADKQPSGSLPFQVLKADLKGDDLRGKIYFDAARGRLVSLESRLTLKGPLTIKVGEITVDAKSNQEITILTKVSDQRPLPPRPAAPAQGQIP